MSCRRPLVNRQSLVQPRKRFNQARIVCLCTRMRTCLRQAFTVWHFAFLGGAYLCTLHATLSTGIHTMVARNTEKCIFCIFSSPFIWRHYLFLRLPNLSCCCNCCCFLSSQAQSRLSFACFYAITFFYFTYARNLYCCSYFYCSCCFGDQ